MFKFNMQGKSAIIGLGICGILGIGILIGADFESPVDAQAIESVSSVSTPLHNMEPGVITVEKPVEVIKEVEVPGPVQTVTETVTETVEVPVVDQAALDAAYADGYATSDEQMKEWYENAERQDTAFSDYLIRGCTNVNSWTFLLGDGRSVELCQDTDALIQDAYDRGVEKGGSWENQAYTTALSTPCAQEDSQNCYWNAATMGNGTGDSFVNIAGYTFYI